MTYPGGKNGSGVYQTIICQIPPHETYNELFAGGGAILRNKRPALASFAIDIDDEACEALAALDIPGLTVLQGSALVYLQARRWSTADFIYLDPPYLMETRSKDRAIYRHEFASCAEHAALLELIRQTPANIAISGYPSSFYDEMLPGWRRIEYQGVTHGGRKPECLWMNYPEPAELHDYRHLGANYRQRENIKKKIRRWQQRLSETPASERYAMLAALEDLTAKSDDARGQRQP